MEKDPPLPFPELLPHAVALAAEHASPIQQSRANQVSASKKLPSAVPCPQAPSISHLRGRTRSAAFCAACQGQNPHSARAAVRLIHRPRGPGLGRLTGTWASPRASGFSWLRRLSSYFWLGATYFRASAVEPDADGRSAEEPRTRRGMAMSLPDEPVAPRPLPRSRPRAVGTQSRCRPGRAIFTSTAKLCRGRRILGIGAAPAHVHRDHAPERRRRVREGGAASAPVRARPPITTSRSATSVATARRYGSA